MPSKPQSPIHRPLEDEEPVSAPPSRIARLAELDQRILAGRPHSLGPGGASSLFSHAVNTALVNEMAEQLREGPFDTQEDDSDIRKWAGEIIVAFREE